MQLLSVVANSPDELCLSCRMTTASTPYEDVTRPRRTPRGIGNAPRGITTIGARFDGPLACPRCGQQERVVVKNQAGRLQAVCLTCKRENERESKRHSRAGAKRR